ncbi:DUF3263 domain-containing protein [Rhodococcus rhodochrous]|uniref:DUF3263 domain-containing protein n=1 Tax=Rhodococcus rhodochrous TaxID=1829 RepID=A0AA46WUZ8_RHORH|nr:DUF3263 domain-containing protein [Rhodococcus rhodochrous]MCB8910586.1 DUF3263 domain-containing protein [Rhodococcus rhodochrous]UZF44773.1 DUF3263 domain-containing protein [Rhodococcus rhodochrous]
MTPDERAMIDFVLRWSPFDDGDEYILPQFGLTPAAFYYRVRTLLTAPTDEIDLATCSLLREICRTKLSRPTPHPRLKTSSATNRIVDTGSTLE